MARIARPPVKQKILWKTKIRSSPGGMLPPTRGATIHPLVFGSNVYVTLSSPGIVVCCDKKTGKIRWKTRANKYANSPAVLVRGRLFVISNTAVTCLDPRNGSVFWKHAPYGKKGEWIYSTLCFSKKCIFYGDTAGYLQCLDLASGKQRWRVPVDPKSPNMSNATALAHKSTIIAASNSGMLAAFSTRTGKPIWMTQIDGPMTKPILKVGKLAVTATDSIFFFDPDSGKIVKKRSWKHHRVNRLISAKDHLVVTLDGDPRSSVAGQILVFKGSRQVGRQSVKDFVVAATISPDLKQVLLLHSNYSECFSVVPLRRVAKLTYPFSALVSGWTISSQVSFLSTYEGFLTAYR